MAQDQIPSASALEDFCKIAPFARIIDLDGYDIDENRMQELEVLLRCNVVLEELTLNAKGMTTLRAAAIASIVGLHPSLQVLRIRASQSPDADKELLDLETFEALWTGIALTKRLVTLNILDVKLGTRGVRSLAPRLAPTLRRLILSGCNVSDTALEALAPALERLPGLYILDLEDNQIGPRGAIALAASINACARLQKVELGMNVLGDTGACTLASALEENQSVLLINIEGNNVGVSGAIAIARMLEVNRRLIALCLRSNEIGDEGAKAIARGILHNQTLERCSIEANRIGDAGAFAIADMLRNTRKLERFSVVRNEFGERGKRVLSEALRTNQTLSHCQYATVTPACAKQ